jgi:hypothetical protein
MEKRKYAKKPYKKVLIDWRMMTYREIMEETGKSYSSVLQCFQKYREPTLAQIKNWSRQTNGIKRKIDWMSLKKYCDLRKIPTTTIYETARKGGERPKLVKRYKQWNTMKSRWEIVIDWKTMTLQEAIELTWKPETTIRRKRLRFL